MAASFRQWLIVLHMLLRKLSQPFAKLVTSSGVAQIITLLMTVVVARLYSAEAFGEFAISISLAALLAAISTGKFEVAAMNPESELEARRLVFIALVLATLVCGIAMGLLFAYSIVSKTSQSWVQIVPLIAFAQSTLQILMKWSNRKRNYRMIGAASVLMALCIGGLQIVFGITLIADLWSLIFGYVLGTALVVVLLSRSVLRPKFEDFRMLDWGLFAKYSSFPKFMVPQTLVSKLTQELPTIVLGSAFDSASAGTYALTRRVLQKPVQLIGHNAGLVMHSSLGSASGEQLRDTYRVVLKLMMLLAVALVLFIVYLGEFIFLTLFGEGWSEVTNYASFLVFAIACQMVAVPLAVAFPLFDRQQEMLFFQLMHLILVGCSYALGFHFSSEEVAIGAQSVFSALLYISIARRAVRILESRVSKV